MSRSDLLKAHMDAVRSVTTTNDKLTISDSTEVLKKPQLADIISLDPATFGPNDTAKEQVKDSGWRFTSTTGSSSFTGFYIIGSTINELGTAPGNYVFECMLRGNLQLHKIGAESSGLIYANISLNETKWKKLRFPFYWQAMGNFDFYGTPTSKSQWFEIKQPCFIKMG